tara:strand:+ start:116023 stop:117279 length:1257 start_codon:yes stop_codon:yes gene_type:complete
MGKARTNKKGSVKLPSFANNTPTNGALQQRYDYIPIDFIKCEVIGLDRDYFEQNMILTKYESKKEKKQVNLSYSKHNMKVTVYPKSKTNRIELSGSLHKFINEGKHNYDQFTENKYYQSLELLNETYGIRPENLKILGLEYGVNITPPIITNEVLNNLIQHKNRDFEHKISNEHGNYYQCERSNYIIKIYNKALQYGCKDEILRIEIKQTNWSEYRKQGLYSLEDFNQCNKLLFLNNLLTKWNDIVFYDPTNKGVEKWGKYSNINFWRELRIKSNKTQKKHRDRLREINKKHGLNVQQLVNDEVVKNVNKLQGVRNYNFTKERRFCVLTGIEITMQRKDSFLLSHGGLYYLRKHEPETFKKIKDKFLSNNWLTSSIYKQVKEIAHVIRSRYNHQLSKYPAYQTSLFDLSKGKELRVYI